jgi:hypothetical protein
MVSIVPYLCHMHNAYFGARDCHGRYTSSNFGIRIKFLGQNNSSRILDETGGYDQYGRMITWRGSYIFSRLSGDRMQNLDSVCVKMTQSWDFCSDTSKGVFWAMMEASHDAAVPLRYAEHRLSQVRLQSVAILWLRKLLRTFLCKAMLP